MRKSIAIASPDLTSHLLRFNDFIETRQSHQVYMVLSEIKQFDPNEVKSEIQRLSKVFAQTGLFHRQTIRQLIDNQTKDNPDIESGLVASEPYATQADHIALSDRLKKVDDDFRQLFLMLARFINANHSPCTLKNGIAFGTLALSVISVLLMYGMGVFGSKSGG